MSLHPLQLHPRLSRWAKIINSTWYQGNLFKKRAKFSKLKQWRTSHPTSSNFIIKTGVRKERRKKFIKECETLPIPWWGKEKKKYNERKKSSSLIELVRSIDPFNEGNQQRSYFCLDHFYLECNCGNSLFKFKIRQYVLFR